ncbi:MAG: hypothetical protein Q4D61_03940 [Cardiobacteriaceae bacterium]|nr:hypothetical protein [Cardiobacteriaceae bacterium]
MRKILSCLTLCSAAALAQEWQLSSVATMEDLGDTRTENVMRFAYHGDGRFTTTHEGSGNIREVIEHRADGQPVRRQQFRQEGGTWQLASETVNEHDDAGQLVAWQSEDFHDGDGSPSHRTYMRREGRQETLRDETRHGDAWQTLSQSIREYDADGQEILLQTAMWDNDSGELRPQLREEREYAASGLIAWRAYRYEDDAWQPVEEGKVHDVHESFPPWVYTYHLSEVSRMMANGEPYERDRSYWLDYHASGILLAMSGMANDSPLDHNGHDLSLTFHLPNVSLSWAAEWQADKQRWHTTRFTQTVYDAARREIESRVRHENGLVHTRHQYDERGNRHTSYIAHETLANGKASHIFEKVSYEYAADIARDDLRAVDRLIAGFPELARSTQAPVAIRRYRFDGRAFQVQHSQEFSYEAFGTR